MSAIVQRKLKHRDAPPLGFAETSIGLGEKPAIRLEEGE
jgi:hypothetical protein